MKGSFEDRLLAAMEPGPADHIRGGTLRIHPDGELEVRERWDRRSWSDMGADDGLMRTLYGMVAGRSPSEHLCPVKTALRDWLHRLDAHGEMFGTPLSDTLVEYDPRRDRLT